MDELATIFNGFHQKLDAFRTCLFALWIIFGVWLLGFGKSVPHPGEDQAIIYGLLGYTQPGYVRGQMLTIVALCWYSTLISPFWEEEITNDSATINSSCHGHN